MADVGVTEFERVRWNLLGDLVFEDVYSLWEFVLGPDLELQERAIRELLTSDSIFLYRLNGLDPNAAPEREDFRLEPEAAQDCVLRACRGDAALAETAQIWVAPTDKGVRAAKDPPVSVRKLWGWADGFHP